MNGMVLLGAYVGALVAALIATPLVLRLSRWMGIVDVPNARKIHSTPTPRAGGIAIAAALFAVLLPGFLWAQSSAGFGKLEGQVVGLLAAAVGLLIVGLLDDAAATDVMSWIRSVPRAARAGRGLHQRRLDSDRADPDDGDGSVQRGVRRLLGTATG